MTKRYDCLIFDADYTLLDYVADEMNAFRRLYTRLGMPVSAALMEDSRKFSEEKWTQAGLYDVYLPHVQAHYHTLYRAHVEHIFEAVFERHGAPSPFKTAKQAGETFLQELARPGTFLPKAKETLMRLSKRLGGAYDICIATNGLSAIQRARLADVSAYADVYVSEDVGAIKPCVAFFQRLLLDRGIDKTRCLMIGDSLVSDVVGAKAAGIDVCWYNPLKKKNELTVVPDYEIDRIEKLTELL